MIHDARIDWNSTVYAGLRDYSGNILTFLIAHKLSLSLLLLLLSKEGAWNSHAKTWMRIFILNAVLWWYTFIHFTSMGLFRVCHFSELSLKYWHALRCSVLILLASSTMNSTSCIDTRISWSWTRACPPLPALPHPMYPWLHMRLQGNLSSVLLASYGGGVQMRHQNHDQNRWKVTIRVEF